jgi:thioredoxin reductase
MWDVIVIGGGVAGLQTAVFTAKAGEETLVIDSGDSLVTSTDKIQNLLTEERIAGEEILDRGRKRVQSFDGDIREATIDRAERIDDGFRVFSADDEFDGKTIVVASADNYDYLESLDLEFEPGREGEFMLEQHIATDEGNRAADGVYIAGLANTWEYQTSVAIGDGAKTAVNLLSDKRGEAYVDHDY